MDSQIITYILLAITAVVYAFVLNTKAGKTFADKFTWASVVVGVSLVLAALWFLIPPDAWMKVSLAFVVAGSPMIIRSLMNKR